MHFCNVAFNIVNGISSHVVHWHKESRTERVPGHTTNNKNAADSSTVVGQGGDC